MAFVRRSGPSGAARSPLRVALAAVLGLQVLCASRPQAATTTTTVFPDTTTTVPVPTSTTAPTTTTTTLPACVSDAACDDANACTVDACVPAIGCRHDPIDFTALGSAIAAAQAVGACAGQPVPAPVTTLLARAGTLVGRAATKPSRRRARRLVQMAGRRLAKSATKAAAAAASLSPSCASALGAAIQTAATEDGCLVQSLKTATPSSGPFACLFASGPLIKLTGRRTKGYSNRKLAPHTRIDARGATFIASPDNHYPISIDGGGGVCVAGGAIRGDYDRSLDWQTMHDMNNAGVSFANPATVDGVRIDNVTDGIRPRGTGPFTIREVHLSYLRDDCVENDHLEGGLIEDSLFDGCYVAISERPSPSENVNGSHDVLTIRGSLIRLQPMPGPRDGTPSELGNGEFFKWSDQATKLALVDNIFMAEKTSQGGPDTMGVPNLGDCAHNVMVWLGRGNYPTKLPACFTVTSDRSVWDNAVADWVRRHPDVPQ